MKTNNLPTAEQLIELATKKGEKLSPADYGKEWPECITDHGKHKGQGVKLADGSIVRNDIPCFYPNGIKPEPTGRKNRAPKGKSNGEKLLSLIDQFNELAEALNIEADITKSKAFITLQDSIKAERDARIKAIEMQEAAAIEALKQRQEAKREYFSRLKASI